MRLGVTVAAALAAAVARGAEPDPRLYAEPRADDSPTPYACTVETLAAGARCVFESTAPPAQDRSRQAVENAESAARLGDRVCAEAARHPLDPIPDPDVLAACRRRFAEKATVCGTDGARPVLDAQGRFGPEFRLCYAALSEVLARARTGATTSAPCCRCLAAEKCGAPAPRCDAGALSRPLGGPLARCADERCREACGAFLPVTPALPEAAREGAPAGSRTAGAPCFDPLRLETPCDSP